MIPKLIYCNGDSFSAGVGLCDADYVDNYENLKFVHNKILDYGMYKFKCIQKNLNGDNRIVINKEKNVSYPNQVSRLLDSEIINSSEGGSSMSSILFRTMLDLMRLKRENRVPDLSLIHLTSHARITIFDCTTLNTDNVGNGYAWIKSFLLNFGDNTTYSTMMKEIVKYQTEFDLLVKYLIEVALVRYVVKEFTGKLPILLMTSAAINVDVRKLLDATDSDSIRTLVEESGILNIPRDLIEGTFHDGTIESDKLVCGHWGFNTVNQFRDSVANYIRAYNG